ncbi:8514_t:CDS:2, partial [Cetraspora pellucida]
AMNAQYCSAHKLIPYKLVFGQLPYCNTNLIDILEGQESVNNNALVSENSESTIASEISSISSETIESDLSEKYFEESQEFDNKIQEINSDIEEAHDISNNITQEIYNNLASSLYDSEIGECSKNILGPEIIEIPSPSTNLTCSSFEQHETVRQSAILNIKRNRELIRSRMEDKYKIKCNRTFEIGEFVKIRIPDIDKNKMSQRSLPCKILQKKTNIDSYQVACQYGILENWYLASEIEPLGTLDYPSLNVVPLNKFISLRQASFKQNTE